ncbi:ABC-2 type transporter [Stanieria cyanosphaera PCC 7437]|uniref:ABC-2 type transporter n=1 Tax=Stanieria cyanosphaera (strain ATCC 29371 / PCC 7437) TaxID=111780 RepID=K9XVL9_STAC7|nr:ABC transporter permease [Stanieria cyanosphaera]AFZ36131.1 ABC-2 type transporter [Stanieria cyanosphaera PCC 7437]
MSKSLRVNGQSRQSNWTVYSPESQIKHPIRLIKFMWRDLLGSRELAWQLFIRNINAQYRQSALGFFWAIFPAIVTAWGFTFAKNSGIVNIGETDLPYPAYVMFSTTLWQTFIESLNAPIQAVNSSKVMLARINFPREAIILSQLGQVGFNFGIKLILIIGLFVWFKMPVTWSVLIAPVGLIHLIILGTAIGLFLAPIGNLYQDISRFLAVATSMWLFLTPVVYPVPTEGTIANIVRLNPVTPLLVTTRELATTGVISNPQGFWLVSIVAIVGLFLAWIFYRQAMPYVVERISS